MTFCKGDPLADEWTWGWMGSGLRVNPTTPRPPWRPLGKVSRLMGSYFTCTRTRVPLWESRPTFTEFLVSSETKSQREMCAW